MSCSSKKLENYYIEFTGIHVDCKHSTHNKKEQRPKSRLRCRSCTFTLLILCWLFSVKRLVLPYYCTCSLQYCITRLHFWPQCIFFSLQDIPPPGSYDISTSFHRSQLKRDPAGARTDSGKLRRGAFLTSQSRFRAASWRTHRGEWSVQPRSVQFTFLYKDIAEMCFVVCFIKYKY